MFSFRIGLFIRVFGIERSNVTLPRLHVGHGRVRQAEHLSRFVALLFVGDGVVAVRKLEISGHKNASQTARYNRKISVVPVVGGQ